MDEIIKKRLSLIVNCEKNPPTHKANSIVPDASNRTPSALIRRDPSDPKQRRSALAELFLKLEDKIEEDVQKTWIE